MVCLYFCLYYRYFVDIFAVTLEMKSIWDAETFFGAFKYTWFYLCTDVSFVCIFFKICYVRKRISTCSRKKPFGAVEVKHEPTRLCEFHHHWTMFGEIKQYLILSHNLGFLALMNQSLDTRSGKDAITKIFSKTECRSAKDTISMVVDCIIA